VYFVLFFCVIFTIIYILFPIIEIIKKVGLNIKNVTKAIISEFKESSKLKKLMIIIAILSFIMSF